MGLGNSVTPHMAAHTALTYPLHLLSSSWVFVVWNVWHALDRLAYFNDENVARRERKCNMGGGTVMYILDTVWRRNAGYKKRMGLTLEAGSDK